MKCLLSTLIFTPWLGALLLALTPRLSPKTSRVLALLYIYLPVIVVVIFSFNDNTGRYNFTWQVDVEQCQKRIEHHKVARDGAP